MTDPFNGVTDPITRLQLLRRLAAGGATLSLPAILAACGGGSGIEAQTGGGAGTTSVKQQLADTLVFANWPAYIDKKGSRRPTLDKFTAETGVDVKYIQEVNDNEEWFGKYQAQLSQGQDIDRDLTVLTDWMAARMIRLGYVERKDKSAIPNEANLVETLQSPPWDPNRDYSLPWQSGLTGIGYNPKFTGGPVTSIEQLLTDSKLKGKVTCLTEMPDTIGLVMLAQGADPTAVDADAFDNAIDMLHQAVDSGQIRRFTGNDYLQDFPAGSTWAAMTWSGDVAQLQADTPGLKWVIPDDGGMIWNDNMLIPTGGDVFTASTYMNFAYDPKIAAEIEAWVNYICPVVGAKEELLKIDPELAKNVLIFPTDEMLQTVKLFDAEAADKTDFKEKFQAVIGA
jgi:spermidine/putrescine transport system substrate-binding protein